MRKKLLRAYWLGNVLTLVIVIAFAAVMIAADIDAERGSLLAILNTASAWTSEASSNLQELADRIAQSAPPCGSLFDAQRHHPGGQRNGHPGRQPSACAGGGSRGAERGRGTAFPWIAACFIRLCGLPC